MSTQIVLTHSRQRNTAVASFAVINAAARAGGPEVYLVVATDEERELTLHPTDTFSVGDQMWQLDRVDNPGTHRWRVVLTRVG